MVYVQFVLLAIIWAGFGGFYYWLGRKQEGGTDLGKHSVVLLMCAGVSFILTVLAIAAAGKSLRYQMELTLSGSDSPWDVLESNRIELFWDFFVILLLASLACSVVTWKKKCLKQSDWTVAICCVGAFPSLNMLIFCTRVSDVWWAIVGIVAALVWWVMRNPLHARPFTLTTPALVLISWTALCMSLRPVLAEFQFWLHCTFNYFPPYSDVWGMGARNYAANCLVMVAVALFSTPIMRRFLSLHPLDAFITLCVAGISADLATLLRLLCRTILTGG